ncbi:hypothetical protein UA08_06291 [Talaromyces atroroseus]|uniref:Major facilitator superfamily (MFS) profile domain-containing protein n=1 Tax=Talaromyces atroroseus TaxID=1441469 RepID=A0A225AGR5_TALAT|nr:hypothetical protein UA08_06291 [Talaromyces atroroseus]OKL58373.1 hypothetical protein UA08_06291 [Talaromyces atroroseus]
MDTGFKTDHTTSPDVFLPSLNHAPRYKFHGIKSPRVFDKANPRNWTRAKKRLLFAALISSSLLADGYDKSCDWNISVDYSSTSMNYGILLQGFGGIFAVPFIEAYGRLPVWFWTQVVTMFMVLGATLSTSWTMFTTFRSLQGFFGTVPQVVGLSIIHNMYEPEDWPHMINIWATTFLVGPFLGPALAGYILVGSRNQWNISFSVLTGLYAISTLLIILFGRETYYNSSSSSSNHSGQARVHHYHPVLSKICSFIGISCNNNNHDAASLPIAKRHTLLSQSTTLLRLIFKVPLLLLGIAVMINFCWPIGITTTVDTFLHAPPYLFDNVQASSMRFAGVIGASSGYIFGHFFNKWIYNYHHVHLQFTRNNSNNDNDKAPENNDLGRIASENSSSLHIDAFVSPNSYTWRPEHRLHGVWFPIVSLAGGLVTYGLTLNYNKSWIGLAFGWIMVDLGMVASTVAITAYALEEFPSHATPVSAIINMWRTCGGFSVAYFQASWIARDGVGVVFGVQAAIVVVGAVLTIVPVFVLAGRKR